MTTDEIIALADRYALHEALLKITHPHDSALHDADCKAVRLELRAAIEALQAEATICHGDDCEELGSFKDSYGQLLAENVRLHADAARYRWWREQWCQKDPVMPDALVHAFTASDLDAAIDAAMGQK